jgi:hypothetical protein
MHQPHRERPREELPGVRVTRQLQVEAGAFGQRCEPGVVREQDPGRIAVRGAAREVRSRRFRRHLELTGRIGDAADDEPRIAPLQHAVLVAQNLDAESPEVRRPRLRARVIVVVAEREHHAVGRA